MTFFIKKLQLARSATTQAEPPSFPSVTWHCAFNKLSSVSLETITSVLRSLPNKQSSCDPIRTHLLKDCIDLFSPFITHEVNESLSIGCFPSNWKNIRLTPVLKKAKNDTDDQPSYRPIANVPVLSKLVERLVSKQLFNYLNSNDQLPALQSAY